MSLFRIDGGGERSFSDCSAQCPLLCKASRLLLHFPCLFALVRVWIFHTLASLRPPFRSQRWAWNSSRRVGPHVWEWGEESQYGTEFEEPLLLPRHAACVAFRSVCFIAVSSLKRVLTTLMSTYSNKEAEHKADAPLNKASHSASFGSSRRQVSRRSHNTSDRRKGVTTAVVSQIALYQHRS